MAGSRRELRRTNDRSPPTRFRSSRWGVRACCWGPDVRAACGGAASPPTKCPFWLLLAHRSIPALVSSACKQLPSLPSSCPPVFPASRVLGVPRGHTPKPHPHFSIPAPTSTLRFRLVGQSAL